MKTLNYTSSVLAVFLLLTTCELRIFSQPDVMYGPQSPPPKDATITFTGSPNDGQIGRVGGKVFTYTAVQLAATTTVYWSMIENSIKLSLEDEVYTGDEILTFSPAESSLASGFLVWKGITTIFIASPNNDFITAYSKFTITVTDQNSGNPISLIDPATLGLDASIGGVMEVSSPTLTYDVRMEMYASEASDGPWEPHLDFYDSRGTIEGGGTAWSSFDYGFYWINDAPELETLNTLDVDEGDKALISVTNLKAIDVETPADDLVLTYKPNSENAPHHGRLERSGVTLSSGETFFQQSVGLEQLNYIHDGSETSKDSIPLMLTDGDGKNIDYSGNSHFYLQVNINPVDDPPELVVNNEITLDEGTSLALTSDDLMATDPESGVDGIIYTVDPLGDSDFPTSGLLKLSDVPLLDGETFTQQDINNGSVTYEHDGSGTITDGFTFRVADEFGHLAEEAGNSIFFFQIAINPSNDDPYITSSFPLVLDEGGSKVITNTLLSAVDEESGPEQVIFILDPDNLMDQPLTGTVFKDGQALGDGDSFTQEDINQSKITFTHDGSETLDDFFGFSVTDGEGGIASDNGFTLFQFRINVNPVNDPPFVANPIPDQSVREEQEFDFTVPENTFGDPDPDDFISIYRFEPVGEVLDWITFDDSTGRFTGVPVIGDQGVYEAVVIGYDSEFEMASDTFKITVNSPVGMNNLLPDIGLAVFPNPFGEQVTIRANLSEQQDIYLSLYTLDGKMIFRKKYQNLIGDMSIPLNVSDLTKGIYQLSVETRDKVYMKKILKY